MIIKLEEKTEKALHWITGILRRKKIPFQIAGGFAAKLYGSPRPLNDIDIDAPEDRMLELVEEVGEYIIFGPARWLDAAWDLQLITLNYHGQEIDIGGGNDLKIYDPKTEKWRHFPAHFDKARRIKVAGIEVPVIPPNELILYKSFLSGDHQKIDIEATQKFLKTEEQSRR